MATAANTTIVQTAELLGVGGIDPETIVTPSIFVDRIVTVAEPLVESTLVNEGRRYP